MNMIANVLSKFFKPKVVPMTIQTKNYEYIGSGFKESWFNKKAVMTTIDEVKRRPTPSKYVPHQGKQECARRVAQNG